MDLLPLELLHFIAHDSELVYYALLSIPRFARSLTLINIGAYMIHFGFTIEVNNICMIWKRHGKLHYKSAPAMVFLDGRTMWYRNDVCGRDDGPAVTYPEGYQTWYRNDLIHREDGPADIHPDGKRYWYLNGIWYTKREFKIRLRFI